MQVLNNKIHTLLHQNFHLQKVTRYQDRYHVFYVQSWPVSSLERLVIFLLFQIFHKPFEYFDVAMYADVYIIHGCSLSEIFFKIFHVSD